LIELKLTGLYNERRAKMYKKILVPLDGSKLAECALPHAMDMAKAYKAKLILVSVTEVVKGFRVVSDPSKSTEEALAPEAGGKLEEQARKYLDKVAKRIEKEGIQVTTDIPYGRPADEIITSSMLNNCDVIVMSSHGRSGVSKWTHGSVADKVFRASPTPVLMIREALCKDLQN
jgi:nucleotide-binding universal stress UspA family protein